MKIFKISDTSSIRVIQSNFLCNQGNRFIGTKHVVIPCSYLVGLYKIILRQRSPTFTALWTGGGDGSGEGRKDDFAQAVGACIHV